MKIQYIVQTLYDNPHEYLVTIPEKENPMRNPPLYTLSKESYSATQFINIKDAEHAIDALKYYNNGYSSLPFIILTIYI